MKRAKIVLTAITMLALVGGALAFKAARELNQFYVVDSTNPVTALRLCTKPVFTSYTTNFEDRHVGVGATTLTQTIYYTTAAALAVCPQTIIYSAD